MVRTTPPALSLLDSGEERTGEDTSIEVVVNFTASDSIPLPVPSTTSKGRESAKMEVSTLEGFCPGGEREGNKVAVCGKEWSMGGGVGGLTASSLGTAAVSKWEEVGERGLV
jgi:hypothetical protein